MPDYPFTVFSGIGFVLCIPPMYFNLKIPNRPWATLFLLGWIMILNLLYFIDSIIWRSTNPDTWWEGKVYCDINFRIKDMFFVGVLGASIGICRFLADATNPNPSQNDLRIILPLMIEAGLFAFQTSRYHVVGVQGCTGWIDYSWPSVLYYALWSPILSCIAAVYACIFLRHWWIRRKRINENWARGQSSGISRSEFRRLIITVLCVIFISVPLSLNGLAHYIRGPKIPYSISRVHGPMWKIIVFDPLPKVSWLTWIGVFLAIISFSLIGLTRNARQFYGHCFQWLYDHLPQKFQARLPWMRNISEAYKARKVAKAVVNGDGQGRISIVEGSKLSRPKGTKNWFDSDDDIEDLKSEQSNESFFDGQDKERGAAREHIWDVKGPQAAWTEVSAGSAPVHGSDRDILVTRQVVVETMQR